MDNGPSVVPGGTFFFHPLKAMTSSFPGVLDDQIDIYHGLRPGTLAIKLTRRCL